MEIRDDCKRDDRRKEMIVGKRYLRAHHDLILVEAGRDGRYRQWLVTSISECFSGHDCEGTPRAGTATLELMRSTAGRLIVFGSLREPFFSDLSHYSDYKQGPSCVKNMQNNTFCRCRQVSLIRSNHANNRLCESQSSRVSMLTHNAILVFGFADQAREIHSGGGDPEVCGTIANQTATSSDPMW